MLKAHTDDPLDRGLVLNRADDCFDGDPGGLLRRVAIRATANRREGDALYRIVNRQLYARGVARRKQFGLAARAASPDRADCMDDVFRGQSIASCYLSAAGLATAEQPA